MKFKIKCCDKGDQDNFWWEDYDKNVDDVDKWGQAIIGNFNSTLAPGEKEREYLGYEIIDSFSVSPESHDFRKTNLVTIMGSGGRSYDNYKCSKCEVTGRRYGFEFIIIRDKKFKSKKYDYCEEE